MKPEPKKSDRAKPVSPAKPVVPAPNPTHWGKVAEWYDELVGNDGNEFHQRIIFPGVLKMLAMKEGMRARILDLACGQGAFCRKLVAAGCDVTGVDAAAALIEAAQRREATDKLGITYITGDATRLKPTADLPEHGFDAITLILAVQNISPLSPMWKACHQLLKPGGKLVIVMMHPAFRIPQRSDWHWDAAKGQQVRTITQYLNSTRIEIKTHPGLAAHGKSETTTPHFHRPLHAYINTLGAAGLLVDHIEEWASHKKSQAGPKQAELDRSRDEIPMFMAIRCVASSIGAAHE